MDVQQPDWNKLYDQGRVKYIGEPWSEEETKILKENGFDLETIESLRDGTYFMTKEEEKQQEKEDKSNDENLENLRAELRSIGIPAQHNWKNETVLKHARKQGLIE